MNEAVLSVLCLVIIFVTILVFCTIVAAARADKAQGDD